VGFYIETPIDLGKADWLLKAHPGEVTEWPARDRFDLSYEAAREQGIVPVVVVENGPYDACAIAYSEREWEEFISLTDPRPRRILLFPEALIRKLSPHCPLTPEEDGP
jgi:hypothetical protein